MQPEESEDPGTTHFSRSATRIARTSVYIATPYESSAATRNVRRRSKSMRKKREKETTEKDERRDDEEEATRETPRE